YLGGSGTDSGWAIAIGTSNKAHVLGVTNSPDLPLANPIQTVNRGGPSDLFVASIKPGPGLTTAAIEGKHLVITGNSFVEGAVILLDGEPQRTIYLSAASLRGKKAGRRIAPGQTVQLQVRNPDGVMSNTLAFTRVQ
ncbi:MAG TPA: hypothetical protein VFV34_22905, partial [Blastocatellia bacterium]|nr:hypothetical protein [Blastocatellia bacterium]